MFNQQYKLIQRHLYEFIQVLKSIRPPDLVSISTQADLLRCYMFMKNSQLSRSVNGALVREYISLLDAVGECCDELHKDFLHWHSDSTHAITEKHLLLPLVENIKSKLDPTFEFSLLPSGNTIRLGSYDQSQFSGLLSFVPFILRRLEELLKIITTQLNIRQQQILKNDY